MNGSDEAGEEKSTHKVTLRAFLVDGSIVVPSSEDVEGLKSRGYGTPSDGSLTLSYYEGLYLLSKGILKIYDEDERLVPFQELLEKARERNKNAWVKYLIYRDLRSRGYVVREGFGLGIDFRVYERGGYGKETAKYLIYGIKEGQPVQIEELARALKYTQNLKKRLILAVLNRRGEIVYYSLSKLAF